MSYTINPDGTVTRHRQRTEQPSNPTSNPTPGCLKEVGGILFVLLAYLFLNFVIIFIVSLIPGILNNWGITVPDYIHHYLEYINIDTSPVSTIIIGIVIAHIIIVFYNIIND